ncbi:MAG TPA: hypothetical protein VH437_01305 [Terriglobales bacterium]|jgi:hypothetical protein
MKLTTAILMAGLATGSAWAQNPDIIQNTRNTMQAVQQKKAADSNAALGGAPSPFNKPTPAATPTSPSTSAPSAKVAKPVVAKKSVAVKVAPAVPAKKAAKKDVKKEAPKEQVAVESSKTPDNKADKNEGPKAISLTGRRDPFLSPVVNRSMVGSGCSTGKKCLAVDQISLKGIIRSQDGMIAVVVNAMNKAYFLRENDPVFNGYVVRITSESIIFKETMQDRLGKPFTREVTKTITTPAV